MFKSSSPWTIKKNNGYWISFAGSISIDNNYFYSGNEAINFISNLFISKFSIKSFQKHSFFGHFGFIINKGNEYLAVSDHVSSYPILYTEKCVTFSSEKLFKNNDKKLINFNQASILASSGYTIGSQTLYKGINRLLPGSILLVKPDTVKIKRHFKYIPKSNNSFSDKVLINSLEELFLSILENIKNEAHGREIIVPLSAGYDSRAIISGFKKIGVKNIHAISYGLKGNFESNTAEIVAQKLCYKYSFVPLSRKSQKEYFRSELCSKFIEFSDCFSAIPFQQDLPPIFEMLDKKQIQPDVIVVNGLSGDFITGNHIDKKLLSNDFTVIDLIKAIRDKHFALWEKLSDYKHENLLFKIIEKNYEIKGDFEYWSLFEHIEYENRQSKYVLGGQRIYDFLGLDWKIPFWDRKLVEFWRDTVSIDNKLNQFLYKKMLKEKNWGGVWGDNLKVNKKFVSPTFIRYLRYFLKVPFAPLGKNSWHQFDRRFFSPLYDNLQNTADFSYLNMVQDKRGARNSFSWLTEKYLEKHGLNWRGNKLES